MPDNFLKPVPIILCVNFCHQTEEAADEAIYSPSYVLGEVCDQTCPTTAEVSARIEIKGGAWSLWTKFIMP